MELPVNYDKTHFRVRKLVREEYERLQEGKCYYCKNDLNGKPNKKSDKVLNMALFPPNFLKWPKHLHHNRKTGMTIGTVHARCNGVLWQYYGE
jgi:hypothetical protein